MLSLTGKVALVTGASSGIGAATAIRLSKLGVHLAIAGRNAQNLKKTSKKCNTENLVEIQADVNKPKDNILIIQETIQKFGRLDILINCAGILGYGTLQSTSLEQFDSVFNTNVRSIYHLTSLAVPHLEKTKGNIVNISSATGLRGFMQVLPYTLSKATLDHFTRCTALELAPKNVRVNSINPGVIKTDIHRRAGITPEQYKAFMDRVKVTHALGRAGELREVTDAIVFLASDQASFITGHSLPVDGGWNLNVL